jgi:hypothetical protein
VRTGGRGLWEMLGPSIDLVGPVVFADAFRPIALEVNGRTALVRPSSMYGSPNGPHANNFSWTDCGDDRVQIGP